MVAIADLQLIEAEYLAKHQEYSQFIQKLPLASSDSPDNDTASTILAEGVFLRYFTLWENSIEKSFIHYCQGGVTLNGHQPLCRLTNCDGQAVRKILTGSQRYLDWSNQRLIRERSQLFFDNGMPFYNPIIGKSHILTDAEKIRNVIAHDSVESWNSYREVQRNNFQTERNFPMAAGQLLRARARRLNVNWGELYFDEISQVFAAILRP